MLGKTWPRPVAEEWNKSLTGPPHLRIFRAPGILSSGPDCRSWYYDNLEARVALWNWIILNGIGFDKPLGILIFIYKTDWMNSFGMEI